MPKWSVVVLAAGVGKRMRSQVPKVLHPLAGRPMLSYVIEAAREAHPGPVIAVVSPQVKAASPELGPGLELVLQEQPLGTGHALAQARSYLEAQSDHVLVLNGDTPLISPLTLRTLMGRHEAHRATLTLLTATVPEPGGLGRILRDSARRIVGVAEDADLSESQRHINEINVGVYAFDADWLWPHLSLVPPAPKGGEFYLTHLMGLAAQTGRSVQGVPVSSPIEALGVNHRGHLAQAEAYLRQQVRERLMLAGVTLLDPPSTFIDATVQIGEDTVVYPNTMLLGATRIGRGCRIGPGAVIEGSTVGHNCRIVASVVEGAMVEDGVDVGPYSHLRPGAYLETGVHLGNYVEVKKSRLGRGTRAGHFSYLGDATIGADVNVGAGTITCNYDGRRHHPTRIGAGAFIGSDTMIVAPRNIGERAVTGAGSVVTHDIGPDEVAHGVPARVRRKRRPEETTPQEENNGHTRD